MSSADLRIETRSEGLITMVALSGAMFLPDVPAVLQALIAAIDRRRHRVAVCDVGGLDPPMTNSLLAVFPAALHRCGGWPAGSLHLARPGADLARTLRAFRMQRYLPVHDDLAGAAVAAALDVPGRLRTHRMAADPAGLLTVRRAVRALWHGCARDGLPEATLIANELATNAIMHVAQPYTLTLTRSARRVVLAVTDTSRQEPIVRPRRGSAAAGRGLQLVHGLASEWGVRLVEPAGKTVWAALPAPALPAPATRRPS